MNQKIFTVHCSRCPESLQTVDQHSSVFDFLYYARDQGWIVPNATDNKPIWCPRCKGTPPTS